MFAQLTAGLDFQATALGLRSERQRLIASNIAKADTPGCTTQACGFRDAYPVIEEQNAVVLGVSPDGVKSHQKFKTKFDLPFILLADEEHTVAEAYGVWQEKENYGRKYMGIVRSHYVIDEQGRIADIQFKVKPEESVTQALAALQ